MAILCYQGEELELLAEKKKKTKRERLGPSATESLLEAPFALSRLFLREGNVRSGGLPLKICHSGYRDLPPSINVSLL